MVEEFNLKYKGTNMKLFIYEENSIWHYLIEYGGMVGSEQETDCKSRIDVIQLAISEICGNIKSDITILKRDILISEILE
jgi:hypothetical protein